VLWALVRTGRFEPAKTDRVQGANLAVNLEDCR
jgi:hypothetical protein